MKDRKETWSGNSVLGRRIWRRYASAPGLISTAGALQLADRLTGAGRLPLLADVQRRWMPRGEIWPHGGSPLRYVQPAFAEPALPTPDVSAAAPSVSSGVRVVQREALPSASTAGKLAREKRVLPPSARSLEQPESDTISTASTVDTGSLGAAIVQRYQETPVGKITQAQLSSPELMRLSEPVEPSSRRSTQVQREHGEPANVTAHPVLNLAPGPVGESRPGPARKRPATSADKRASADEGASVNERMHATKGEPSAEIVQRYEGTPIRQISRPPTVDSASLSSRPLVEPRSQPSGDLPSSTVQGQSSSPISGDDLGMVTVQRHLETPIKQVSRTPLTAAGPTAGLAEPLELASGTDARAQRASAGLESAVSDRPLDMPLSHSVGEPRSEDTQTAPSAADVGGDLGAAIVQRYEGTPMKQASPATVAAGEARLSESLTLASRADAQVQRVSAEPGGVVPDRPLAMPPSRPAAGEPEPVEVHAVHTAAGGDLGAAIAQRHVDDPVGRVVSVQHVMTSAVSGQATTQADPLKASGVSGDLGATILQRHLGGPVSRAGERQQLTVVSRPARAAPQETTGLSRSLRSVRQASDPGVQRRGASVFEQHASPRAASLNVEMPLAEKVGGSSAPSVQHRPTASGAPPTIVQRATGAAATSPGASAPTSVPASPGSAPSGTEGPDLERLASEVYAIIERRLIIERESRGL